MKALLAAIICAISQGRKPGPTYPIANGNLPTVGAYRRVLNSAEFTINIPKFADENQETFILFISSEKIDQETRKLKSSVQDDKGHTDAEIMYRITKDTFLHADVHKSPVAETEARLNRETHELTFVDNAGVHIAGFYWATYKIESEDKTVWYKDFATAVVNVEQCEMTTKWTTDIEAGYGWTNTANGIEFNEKGFSAGTQFAVCEFKSSPAMPLSWNNENFENGFNTIIAAVPAKAVNLPETIACSMPKDTIQWVEDHCEGPIISNKEVTAPPSKLQYAESVSPSNREKVWSYIEAGAANQIFEFSCPLVNQANIVRIKTRDSESGIINQVAKMNGIESDIDECVGTYCWDVTMDGYDMKVNMTTFENGLHEFRCKYETGDLVQKDDIVGYSRPHIVVKYVAGESGDNSIVPSWGLGVNPGSSIIKESNQEVNVANCRQTTKGYPAPMALKINSGKKTRYLPEHFTEQHFISLNSRISSDFDQAVVSCVYKVEEGNSTVEKESALENSIKVLYRPRNIQHERHDDLIMCTAEISSLDSARAALSINANHVVPMVDGVATFNVTHDYTKKEIEKSQVTGVSCIVVSDNFEGDFKSNNEGGQDPTEPPSLDAETHLTGPILLCLFGAGAVLAICFFMPATKKEPEAAKYSVADDQDDEAEEDHINEDDPLASAEKV